MPFHPTLGDMKREMKYGLVTNAEQRLHIIPIGGRTIVSFPLDKTTNQGVHHVSTKLCK